MPPHLAQPAVSCSQPSIKEWLASIELEEYAAAINQRGYKSLSFVKNASKAEIDELALEIGIQNPWINDAGTACYY